jgi:hypothetical protein
VIDLAIGARTDEGMTLAEVEAALDRIRNAGATDDTTVLVYASRLHRIRRIEVRLDDPDGQPVTAAAVADEAP